MRSIAIDGCKPYRPLVTRHAEDTVAIVTRALPALTGLTGPVSCHDFLNHVHALAFLLPEDGSHVLNLCENRYLLLVSFCAIVARGKTNLLPPNTTLSAQESLVGRYDGTFIIHDGAVALPDVPTLDLTELPLQGEPAGSGLQTVPLISPDHIAALMFTSGSTGQSRPIIKTWQTLADSTLGNLEYFLPDRSDHLSLLATVPARHMWGFETSLLPALFADVSLVDSRPMFPLDVQDSLEGLTARCALITSPVHLRAIAASKIDFPPVERLLCATAPLSKDLAIKLEQRFSAPLIEIFGCSEIGSIAHRETARDELWQPFDHIAFTRNDSGTISVKSTCVPQPIILEDRIEIASNGNFQLLGRTSDQIKIGGKRASLDELNRCLLLCSGLEDGVIFDPPHKQNAAGERRLAAMLVASENASPHSVTEYLRTVLDPAFMPRPIVLVPKLPRADNGKLPKEALFSLYQSVLAQRISERCRPDATPARPDDPAGY